MIPSVIYWALITVSSTGSGVYHSSWPSAGSCAEVALRLDLESAQCWPYTDTAPPHLQLRALGWVLGSEPLIYDQPDTPAQ